MEFETLEGVLVWIVAGGGAMILAGYVEAYLLENWAGWHDIDRRIKLAFPIVLGLLLGVIAQALLNFDVLPDISPAVGSIVLWAINWLFSQKAYKGIKEGEYAASARLERG